MLVADGAAIEGLRKVQSATVLMLQGWIDRYTISDKIFRQRTLVQLYTLLSTTMQGSVLMVLNSSTFANEWLSTESVTEESERW